ncbi:MAG: hypothetical protein R3C15_15420 [Thermoleophilia bacterium]
MNGVDGDAISKCAVADQGPVKAAAAGGGGGGSPGSPPSSAATSANVSPQHQPSW